MFLCLMHVLDIYNRPCARAFIFKDLGGLIPFRDDLKLKLDPKPQKLHRMGNLA